MMLGVFGLFTSRISKSRWYLFDFNTSIAYDNEQNALSLGKYITSRREAHLNQNLFYNHYW